MSLRIDLFACAFRQTIANISLLSVYEFTSLRVDVFACAFRQTIANSGL
ncbi:hypothetical protein [Prevotella jejuni]